MKVLTIFDRKIRRNSFEFNLTSIIVELIVLGLGNSLTKAGFPNAPSFEKIISSFQEQFLAILHI